LAHIEQISAGSSNEAADSRQQADGIGAVEFKESVLKNDASI
jgi:hypothetical protein